MALSKINTAVGSAGLGRQAINKDKVSGFFTYNANLPSGFASNARVKKANSLDEAIALGITNTANFLVEYYHISEFFRINPEGQLWIGWFAVPGGAYDYVELVTLLGPLGADGEIRQVGIYASARTWTSADVTLINSVLAGMDAAYRQTSILFACDFTAIVSVTGWATVTDLRTLTANKVTVVIAEGASGQALVLATAKAYSITALGTMLGAVSKAGVEESIGNPERFPLSNGVEMETLALANGDLLSAISLATLGSLKDKGYLIARKYTPDLSGSYAERAPVAIAATHDLAWLEMNRTVDKAIRGIRTALTPKLQGRVALNSDGTISNPTIGFFKDTAQAPLTQMQKDGEVSDAIATIDPNQNVLSTSKLVIGIKIIPVGIAETIDVNIDLVTSLT